VHHQPLFATTLLAASTESSKTFHIGPWIIVPILILVAIIGTVIYVIRDRRKRQSHQPTR
jgi:hypothetical protein